MVSVLSTANAVLPTPPIEPCKDQHTYDELRDSLH